MVDLNGMVKCLVDVLSEEEISSIFGDDNDDRKWGKLKIITLCSGTDAPIIALEALLKILNDTTTANIKHKIEMEHVFSCEIDKYKREFIKRTTNPPLLFNDVKELASGKTHAHDEKTKRKVPKDFNILVAGTDCKDFSTLNKSRKSLNGGGKSDVTFHSVLKFTAIHQPAIVVLENVANCPIGEMIAKFEDIGYIGVHKKVCTSEYILPQQRNRAYFVFLHKKKARFSSGSKEKWISTMNRLGKEKPLKWTDFLIDSPKYSSDVAPNQKGNRGKPLSESLNSKWLKEIEKIEDKEDLTHHNAKGGRPYSDATKNIPALSHLTDRAKMRLDVQCKRALKNNLDPFETPLIWNPAQQVRFTDTGFNSRTGKAKTIAPCVTPKHEWIVSNLMRPFSGEEALALQGIFLPKEVVSEFKCKQLRDLAGNAQSTTVLAAVFLSIFSTVELVSIDSKKKRRARSDDIAKRVPKRRKRG